MTKEQKFLIDNHIADVVVNKHEKDYTKLIYVSDVMRTWAQFNSKTKEKEVKNIIIDGIEYTPIKENKFLCE